MLVKDLLIKLVIVKVKLESIVSAKVKALFIYLAALLMCLIVVGVYMGELDNKLGAINSKEVLTRGARSIIF